MLEVEFTSELMIAELDGLQDKKKSINDFYQKYDEAFSEQRRVESRFSAAVDEIEESVGEVLGESEFVRAPLFYSLFCAVYHRTFGLPKLDLATPKRLMTPAERNQLASTLVKLSEMISRVKEEEDIPGRYSRFVTACLRQTDNLEPRRIRLQTLYREAF